MTDYPSSSEGASTRHKAEPDHAVSCSGSYSQLDYSDVKEARDA